MSPAGSAPAKENPFNRAEVLLKYRAEAKLSLEGQDAVIIKQQVLHWYLVCLGLCASQTLRMNVVGPVFHLLQAHVTLLCGVHRIRC